MYASYVSSKSILGYIGTQCFFLNFETDQVKQGHFENCQKSRGWFIPKIARTKAEFGD